MRIPECFISCRISTTYYYYILSFYQHGQPAPHPATPHTRTAARQQPQPAATCTQARILARDATISRWDGLTVSKKAVEGHVTGIFRKLRIPDAKRFDRRVAAVLTYLQASGELASQRPFA